MLLLGSLKLHFVFSMAEIHRLGQFDRARSMTLSDISSHLKVEVKVQGYAHGPVESRRMNTEKFRPGNLSLKVFHMFGHEAASGRGSKCNAARRVLSS